MRRGRPLNDAVMGGSSPAKEVKADSMAPDIVITKELAVVVVVLEIVVWEVRVVVASDGTEKLLTPGEQPTKFGADSLTELHVAMLNAIAPGYHQQPCMAWKLIILTALVRWCT